MILVFVKHLNESVKGRSISSDIDVSPVRILLKRKHPTMLWLLQHFLVVWTGWWFKR